MNLNKPVFHFNGEAIEGVSCITEFIALKDNEIEKLKLDKMRLSRSLKETRRRLKRYEKLDINRNKDNN